jgi:hypothetical protein
MPDEAPIAALVESRRVGDEARFALTAEMI